MRPPRNGFVALAAAFGLVAASALARAETPQTERDRAEAKALVKEGAALFDAGDTAGALGYFDRAYARFPAPAIQFNRAQALRALGRKVDAAAALDTFLTGAPDAAPEKRRDAEEQLKGVDAELGHLRVAANVDGADVLLDGAPAGQTPLAKPLRAVPGKHAVSVTKPSLGGFSRDVTLEAGGEVTVVAVLAALRPDGDAPAPRAPAAVAPPPPPVTITPPPAPPAAAPPFPPPWAASPGAEALVTSNGASAAAVDTGGGQRRATLRTAAIASAAVGVGAVAVGAIFGLRARSKNSEALSLCADGSCATQAELDHHDALVGEARDARTTSIIAFAGGGAALAAGAIVYVLSSSDHPATSARLAPSFGPRGVALTFGGAFDAF